MNDDTLYGILDEIARIATEAEVDREALGEIVGLANRGMAMIGNPDEVMASKAAKVQTLVAEGVDPAEAIDRAGLGIGE